MGVFELGSDELGALPSVFQTAAARALQARKPAPAPVRRLAVPLRPNVTTAATASAAIPAKTTPPPSPAGSSSLQMLRDLAAQANRTKTATVPAGTAAAIAKANNLSPILTTIASKTTRGTLAKVNLPPQQKEAVQQFQEAYNAEHPQLSFGAGLSKGLVDTGRGLVKVAPFILAAAPLIPGVGAAIGAAGAAIKGSALGAKAAAAAAAAKALGKKGKAIRDQAAKVEQAAEAVTDPAKKAALQAQAAQLQAQAAQVESGANATSAPLVQDGPPPAPDGAGAQQADVTGGVFTMLKNPVVLAGLGFGAIAYFMDKGKGRRR